MGRDVESLVSFMKAVLVPELYDLDSTIPAIPFRDEIYDDTRSLRIGYYHDDGYYPAIPACHRAVDMAKTVLELQGHSLVKIGIPDVKYAMEKIGLPAVFGDDGKMSDNFLPGEEMSGDKIMPFWILRLPRPLRYLLYWFESFRDPDRAELILASQSKRSVPEWWTIVALVQKYRQRVIEEWKKEGLDAVICPVAACVALPYGVVTRLGGYGGFRGSAGSSSMCGSSLSRGAGLESHEEFTRRSSE